MAATIKPSPFAPKTLPKLPPIDGVRFGTAEANVRYTGRTDLMLALMEPGTVAAGVTTTSKTCSAPVLWCREQFMIIGFVSVSPPAPSREPTDPIR